MLRASVFCVLLLSAQKYIEEKKIVRIAYLEGCSLGCVLGCEDGRIVGCMVGCWVG